MAKASVTVRLDAGRVSAVVGKVSTEGLRRASTITTERARANVRALGRVDTGRMVGSIRTRSVRAESGLVHSVLVSSDVPYTIFQEKGTRAHGPVRAPRLVFRPKGSNQVVFAKWVRGVKAGNFMLRAIRSLRASDFR